MKAVQTDLSLEGHRLRRLLGGTRADDAATYEQAEHGKSVSVLAPQDGDDITMFRCRHASTLVQAIGVLRGSGGPSVTLSVVQALDRSASGTKLVDGAAIDSTSTGTDAALASVAIPADAWVWIEVATVSGTVDEMHLTLVVQTDA